MQYCSDCRSLKRLGNVADCHVFRKLQVFKVSRCAAAFMFTKDLSVQDESYQLPVRGCGLQRSQLRYYDFGYRLCLEQIQRSADHLVDSLLALGWGDSEPDVPIILTGHRQAQQCCSCSTGPMDNPTPPPIQLSSSDSFTCPPGENCQSTLKVLVSLSSPSPAAIDCVP